MSEIKPMNLVFIFSDQHSKRMLGCYGNPAIQTPNLDHLAQEGVRFENAYCNSPICVPSRAAMATGNFASRNGYWDNAHAFAGEVPSWGSRLTEQGYRVTTIGKLHYKDERPESGFPDQRIPLNIKNGVGDVYGAIRDAKITRYQFRDALLQAGPGESDYIRYDRAIAERAAAFLQNEGRTGEKPFCLFVGFVTPHFPLIVPQEYFDLYRDVTLPRPIAFDQAEWGHHPLVDDYRRYCGTDQVTEEQALHAIRTYYALCSFMDAQAGVVLDALRESGLSENTRIIYTADHGDTMGDHGVYFKSTMYEGSAGIPMILSGPELPKGTSVGTNVSLVDLYPTILEGLGAVPHPADASLPGKSLWNFAQGVEDSERVVFSEYYSQGIYTAMFLLKKGDWKYVHYVGERPQLFHLGDDPLELNDLAEDPAYASVCASLYEELCRLVNPEALETASKQAQAKLLEAHGGVEQFLANFKPALFSPIPDLSE